MASFGKPAASAEWHIAAPEIHGLAQATERHLVRDLPASRAASLESRVAPLQSLCHFAPPHRQPRRHLKLLLTDEGAIGPLLSLLAVLAEPMHEVALVLARGEQF